MNQVLFSIIVPVYKVEDYLDKCISSIANQEYENYEIILVDDGSPDKCPEICDNWAKNKEHIKVLHKKTVDQVVQEILVCVMQGENT